MSKAHRAHHREVARAPARAAVPDSVFWVGFLMVGVFAVALWYLIDAQRWALGAVVYLLVIAVLTHVAALGVYRGRHGSAWQRSLARLVLHWAGFGGRRGRPLDAARGSPRARTALVVSVAASAAVIGVLGWLAAL